MAALDGGNPTTFEELDNKQEKSAQLQKVIDEIKEIKDKKNTNDDKIDIALNNELNDAFKEGLAKEEAQILLNEMDTIAQEYSASGTDLPEGFTALQNFLSEIVGTSTIDEAQEENENANQQVEISKENAEFTQNEIQVTLRGKRNIDGADIDQAKQEIATQLNSYVELRDCLPDDVQKILVLSKTALTTASTGENGESDAVKALETALGMIEGNPNGDIHDTVDGKFGDQTYKKLLDYIDASLKDNSEIIANKINVTLRGKRNEENVDIAQVKEDIATQLNTIKTENRDTSWTDDKKLNDKKAVLLLTKAALESTSDDNGESGEVRALENKLVELNAMQENQTDDNTHNGVDGRFGTETYKIVIAYLTNVEPDEVSIDIPETEISQDPDISTNSDNDNQNLNINQLKDKNTLTIEQAQRLATQTGELDLAITTIDIEVATALGEHTGVLKLNSLTELTDTDIATQLAKNKGDLYLDGLTEISVDVATVLDQHEGYISLQGITTLSGEIAHALEGHDKNLGFGGKIFDKTNITTTDENEGTTYEYTETSVEGTISFNDLREKLPITDNKTINTIMGNISALNDKLNEGESINELNAKISDIDNKITNIQRQKAEIEGGKTINDERIQQQIDTITSQISRIDTELTQLKKNPEKPDSGYKKKNQDNATELERQKAELEGQKAELEGQKANNLIKSLENEEKSLGQNKENLENTLKSQKEIKKNIINKITELEQELITELSKSEDDEKKDAITNYINETIPQYIKGLDGQTKKTATETINPVPAATVNNPTNKPGNGQNQLKTISKTVHKFVDILAEWRGSLFPGSESAQKLINLREKYNFKDKIEDNENIEKNEDVYEILLGLKSIKDAEKADGFEEITNVIENGDENKVRDLQMKLWTPDNNLPITGRIDKNTAKLLKNYITKAPKDEKESLSYQCLDGYSKKTEINNPSKKIEGTIYSKGEDSNITYIFIGTLNGETCIGESNEEISITEDSVTIPETAKIHRANGEIESGTFNENRELTKGKRYNPDGTIKETVPTETA